jgi:hypothetical protein
MKRKPKKKDISSNSHTKKLKKKSDGNWKFKGADIFFFWETSFPLTKCQSVLGA